MKTKPELEQVPCDTCVEGDYLKNCGICGERKERNLYILRRRKEAKSKKGQKATCKTCLFCERSTTDYYKCRRFPGFTSTVPTAWCGEYKSNQVDIPMRNLDPETLRGIPKPS